MNFSVLMAVYAKEKPEFLERALISLEQQEIKATEVVIVFDGPLTAELYDVVNRYKIILNIIEIQLEKNIGLGKALNIGLKKCSYDLIARMDSDDISLKDRFKKQIEFHISNPDIDVFGTWTSEFDEDENVIYAYRKTPILHSEILKAARFRNPIVHVTAMFKKQSVLDIGSYSGLVMAQDYNLWVRMLMAGYRFANIPEVLVNVRAGKSMYRRRSGFKRFLIECKVQKELHRLGLSGFAIFSFNIVTNFIIRVILPAKSMSIIYSLFLRKKK